MQLRRHVVGGDAQCQAFHHGSFANAGFTGEDGVVLPASGEYVDHQTNFRITAQHRVEFAFTRTLGQVDAILIQIGGLAGAASVGGGTRRAGIATTHGCAGIAQGTRITGFGRGFG